MQDSKDGRQKSGLFLRRLPPILVLLLGLGGFFYFDLGHYLTFAAFKEHRQDLVLLIDGHGALAVAVFLCGYTAIVAFSVPGATVLTIAAGFFFGTALATVCVVVAATLGATCLFLAARTAFGGVFKARVGPALAKMEEGFRDNAFNYLLVLRLIPLFPFWLVNLVPAFLGVDLRTYVLATFVGIIPGSLVYASVGRGLGRVVDEGRTPDLGVIFTPEVLLPLIGLALLALLPVAYKWIKKRRAG